MMHFDDRSHSYHDSQSESIDVYVPISEYGSPVSRRDEGICSNYESILICNEVDIETELDKVREATDADSVFKVLSMHFYDRKPSLKDENPLTCPGLALNSERSHRSNYSNKNLETTPKLKPSVLPKQLLHHNYFDVDKFKLMNLALSKISPKNQSDPSPANKNSQGKYNRSSLISNLKLDQKAPNNPLKSTKNMNIHRYTLPSSTKNDSQTPKQQQGPTIQKRDKTRETSDSLRLSNLGPRRSIASKAQPLKNAIKTPSSKNMLQKDLSFRHSMKPVFSENTPKNSVSPRVIIPEYPSKAKHMSQKTSSLKEQILKTLSNKIPGKKLAKQNVQGKADTIAHSISKNAIIPQTNPLKGKRGTAENMSLSLLIKEGEKEDNKKQEGPWKNSFKQIQRLRTYGDEENAQVLAIISPPKNLSAKNAAYESSKKTPTTTTVGLNHQENHGINSESQEAVSKKTTMRVLQNLKGKLRGISLADNSKLKDLKGNGKSGHMNTRLHFKTKLNMTSNERTKDTDSTNCKDSFLSLQSKTLEI